MHPTEDVRSPFASADRAKFGIFQWRSLFTSGMGVFTDGYDLSSIAIVLPLILQSYGINHLIGWQSSLLVGSSLIGAAGGALLFGVLANHGSKKYRPVQFTTLNRCKAIPLQGRDANAGINCL